jgi:putative zinc finger protein
MSCLDADTVLAFVDGAVSGERAVEIETHIDGCAACRRLISEAAAAGAESDAEAAVAALRAPGSRWPWIAGLLVLLVGGGLGVWHAWPDVPPPARAPTVTRLVNRHGQVLSARAGPGGVTIATVAFGDGIGIAGMGAMELVRCDGAGGTSALPNTSGMLVVAADAHRIAVVREVELWRGTLRGKLALLDEHGAPLPLAGDPGNVVAADFLPDGRLAVVRVVSREYLIEAPLGTIVYRSSGELRSLRASQRGELAFVEALPTGVRVLRLVVGGAAGTVGDGWRDAWSVLWRGDRLLVSGTRAQVANAIWDGDRPIYTAGRPPVVMDVSGGGGLIVVEALVQHRTFARLVDWDRAHDVSWSDRTTLYDMSLDGRWVSMGDRSGDVPAVPTVIVRALATRDAVQLGPGLAGVLRSDGRHVVTHTVGEPYKLVDNALSTSWDGVHVDAKPIARGAITYYRAAGWIDDRTLALVGDSAHGSAVFTQQLGGEPEMRGPWSGRVGQFRVSPDGKSIGDVDANEEPAIVDLATMATATIPHHSGEVIVGWRGDSGAVWIADLRRWPIVVTGHARDGSEWRQLEIPAPNAGALAADMLRIAADGQTYAFSVATIAFELYRVDGTP